jgi:hypothetical protein
MRMIRWIIDMFRRRRAYFHREWAEVPPPNWRSSRGGRDFW